MRPGRLLLTFSAAAFCAALVTPARSKDDRRFRTVRASDAKSKQHLLAGFSSGRQTCLPDIPGATDDMRTFEVLGEDFDPSNFDEISVARDGRMIAYATSVSEAGVPGTSKEIVLLPEGPGETSIRIEKIATDDDQPSLQFDDFGVRCAFRSSAGPRGAAPSNIQLHGRRRVGAEDEVETIAVTSLSGGDRAFDPALAARTRVREIAAGVKVKERDASVAFISTGDLVPGQNSGGREQLFLWQEADDKTRQLTHHTDDEAHLSRPQIAKSGEFIAFESSADLTPGAVDPLDTSRVGNPNHVRQIYVWRLGSGLEQITWSDEDCFSPRLDVTGRFILFSSRGDPITGGNPEGNSEIFRWVAHGPRASRLTQLTQTAAGDSVLPRPTLRPDVFAFFSTARPPVAYDPDSTVPADRVVPEFGDGNRQCGAHALLYRRGRVLHVHGKLDRENFKLLLELPEAQRFPIVTGPPVPGFAGERFFFATNDVGLVPKPDRPDGEAPVPPSPFAFFVAMAARAVR